MFKKKSAQMIIRIAEKAAVYAVGKASIWNHYQRKEPGVLRQKK